MLLHESSDNVPICCLSECRVRPKTEASFRITARLQPHGTSRPPQTSIRPNTIGMNGVCMICDPKQNQRKAMQMRAASLSFQWIPAMGSGCESKQPIPDATRCAGFGDGHLGFCSIQRGFPACSPSQLSGSMRSASACLSGGKRHSAAGCPDGHGSTAGTAFSAASGRAGSWRRRHRNRPGGTQRGA